APIAALAADQVVSVHGDGSQSTAPFNAGAGDLLVAFVSSDGPPDARQSASVSGAGLAWTNVRRSNGQRGTAEIWTAVSGSPLSAGVVTADQAIPAASGGAPFHLLLSVLTFSHSRGSGASAAASSATGAASATLTTTASGSAVFGVGNDANLTVPRVVPGNEVVLNQAVGTGGDSHWLQGLASPTAGAGLAVSIGETAPIDVPWNFAAVE